MKVCYYLGSSDLLRTTRKHLNVPSFGSCRGVQARSKRSHVTDKFNQIVVMVIWI